MDRTLHEALRLWLRDAQVPEIIEVLELFAAELRTRNLVLEFVTEYEEVLPGGSPQGRGCPDSEWC